jgi:curved DNA-binding protein CbpA
MVDKRDFKRYNCKTECDISIDADVYRGFIVDYSDGLGIITEKTPVLKEGAEADIRILNSGEEIKVKVVWVKEEDEDIRVGFKRVGNLKGNLKDFKHIDLLMGLQRGTKTGTLEVVSGSVVKKIYIKNGDMIFAASNLIDDRLGEGLVKKGRISVEQFNLATQRLLETGEKLGKVLVDMSCMSPHELYQAVRQQVEGIILSIFDIEEGDFEFREGSLSKENLVTLVISAANIIYRGMKRIKSYNYIKQMFPSPGDVLAVSQQPMNIFQSISLDDTDKQVLQSINGRDPLSKLLSLFPDNDFETLKTISAFLSIGIITIKEQGDAPAEGSASDILEGQDDGPPEEFLTAADKLYAKCELADYYDFLAIDREAGEEEIQRAYYSISKRFHPDRHFTFPAYYDIKGKLIKIFTYATEANNVLSDPDRKEKYDSKLLSNDQNTLHKKEAGEAPPEKLNAMNEGPIQVLGVDDRVSDSNDLRIGNEQEIEEASVAPYEMGIAYLEMGLVEEAMHEFRDALKLTSQKVRSTKMIAECYIRQGNNQKAIDEMKKLMSEISSDKQEYMDMKYELADVYIKSSEYTDAFTLLDEIKSEDPDFRDVAEKIETVSSLMSNG